jgi:hypothetical protein
MSRTYPTRRRRQPRQKREGAALLIVLFVLMLATGTAAYTLQSTQFEVRAAGSLHQAMRTKYVAEAATVSVLALCYQTTAVGCTDLKRADGNLSGDLRQTYALPDWGASEIVYSLSRADLNGTSFPAGTNALASDAQLSGGGVAAAYTPTFNSVIEKWDVPNPGETRPRFRLIVSTYGALDFDADNDMATVDDTRGTGELRFAHQTISATRAFFDVR